MPCFWPSHRTCSARTSAGRRPPPDDGPLLGGLQLFEENSSFLFDGREQIRHSLARI